MTQRLRLVTGLVLFGYVSTHLLNHALGLISLQAAEAGRLWFLAFWRSLPGTLVLYPSLLTHVGLALWALYQRRHFRLPPWEIVRLTLGLLIPLQLISHVFGTRLQFEVAGVQDSYTRTMTSFWVVNPQLGIQQVALLLAAWTHGCIGLYYWLRVQPRREYTLPALQIVGIVLPLLALGGVADLAARVQELATDPDWLAETMAPAQPEAAAALAAWRERTLQLFVVSVGLVFAARPVRSAIARRRKGVVRVCYPSGREVLITVGTTVLEASRQGGVPHASLCGGRGRCSTCRTRIGAGLAALPPPSAAERRVLGRVGAPPNVRLACQLRPTADLEVFPLLPAGVSRLEGAAGRGQALGQEQEIAILFADMRSFTRFAEHRLPYDVVFVLNEYFAAMGGAVEQAGGRLDKFIGDGVMALFGLDGDIGRGCRQALEAAIGMGRALDQLNRALAHDLGEPLQIGIGIHAGQVIVGEMGHGRARALTAIGDAVNTASRLESLTKELRCQLVLSEDVALFAGRDLSHLPSQQIEVRGRTRPLTVYLVERAKQLEGTGGE
jgi:adenylate cyclase